MGFLEQIEQGIRIFQLSFSDGTIVRFRLLNWEESKIYIRLFSRPELPLDLVAERIFRDCVVDQHILNRMDTLRAGVVSTIVELIIAMSGPVSDVEKFNKDLDEARALASLPDSFIVTTICRAFPAYKPEDIETMDWDKVQYRLAQAESILIPLGQLNSPLKLTTGQPKQNEASKIFNDPLHGPGAMPSDVVNVNDLVANSANEMRDVAGFTLEEEEAMERQKLQLTVKQQEELQAMARKRMEENNKRLNKKTLKKLKK